MDAASSQLLVDAGSEGYERRTLSRPQRPRPQPGMTASAVEPAEAGPHDRDTRGPDKVRGTGIHEGYRKRGGPDRSASTNTQTIENYRVDVVTARVGAPIRRLRSAPARGRNFCGRPTCTSAV